MTKDKTIDEKLFIKDYILNNSSIDSTFGITAKIKFNENTPEKYIINCLIMKTNKNIISIVFDWEQLDGFIIISKDITIANVIEKLDNWFYITLSDGFSFFIKIKK